MTETSARSRSFDPSKPCTTRDGRSVRILCTDAKGGHKIVGLVMGVGAELARQWYPDGTWHPEAAPQVDDLINVPTKRRGWIGVMPYIHLDKYIAMASCVYASEDRARLETGDAYSQYIEIEFDE